MTLHNQNKILVVGNYRFTGKLLGKGNFARVEEAIHTILNAKVAIKIMDLNNIKEDYVLKNLYREAKLLAKLNHPCIISLYQTMQRTEQVYYLVTELASGGDLCTYIKKQKNGKLDEVATRRFARQFVSALSHMHGLGVIHRDLKMENVMLNVNQTVIKIVDFGLSNLYAPDRLLQTHCGSPEYAAPELFVTGRKYGPEVDIWSLGIILYGMVVGQLPFISNRSKNISSEERRKELVSQINKGLNSTHKTELKNLSEEFRNMLNRMLIAEHTKRITTKKLLQHTWITENGKRYIRSNPIKKIDEYEQIQFITELSNVLKQPLEDILDAIRNQPLNKIGGMYNILAHLFALSRLKDDGVSKILPSVIISNDESRKLSANQNVGTQPINLRSTHSSIGQRCIKNIDNLKTTEYRKKMKIITEEHSYRKSSLTEESKLRPKTMQMRIEQKNSVDYRMFKSPNLRRKAYSASLSTNQKIYRPTTVSTHSDCFSKNTRVTSENMQSTLSSNTNTKAKRNSNMMAAVKSTQPEQKFQARSPLSLPTSAPSKTCSKIRRKFQNGGRPMIVKLDPEITAKVIPTSKNYSERPKLEMSWTSSSNRRPETTEFYSRILSAQKDQSEIIINQARAVINSERAFNRPTKQQQKQHRLTKNTKMEKYSSAYSAITARALVNKNIISGVNDTSYIKKPKQPIIYDPIARSIADYVTNNVPNKFPF